MIEPGGILVTPSNNNGNTLRNVLAIMFDKACISAEKLPTVDKILFIETPELKEMIIDGKAYSLGSGYEQIMQMLGLESVEIRRKKLTNPTTDISHLIVSAVKEVGPESIILDLTNGKKDITGSLYTSAIISGIHTMTYTEVKKAENGSGYYDLAKEETKNGRYSLKKMETMDGLAGLAAMNNIEFIAYKKNIRELRDTFPNSSELENYCATLDSAVDHYFRPNDKELHSCIQKIGLINENLVGKVSDAFRSEGLCDERKFPAGKKTDPFKVIGECQERYNEFYKSESKLSDTDRETYQKFVGVFAFVPPLLHCFNTVRVYRNTVSHNGESHLTRDDAKLCIEIMLKILSSLCASTIARSVFGGDSEVE